MLQQLAAQLQEAEGKSIVHDHTVPLVVLMSFLFTGWLVYTGIVQEIIWYLDPLPSSYAATLEYVDNNPTVTLNGFTFDHNLNPDLYYTPGYGYSE